MKKRYVVAAFDTDRGAIVAIEDLKHQEFTTDEISVISKNQRDTQHIMEE
ncbi:general stress protein [Sporosarcina sp. P13]|nr:general stress protein [Sporosarcina sp. P13]